VTANDAAIKVAIANGDTAKMIIKAQHDTILAQVARSAVLAQRNAQLELEAATANAAKLAAQRATVALRRQLGRPQNTRDSTYQQVIDSLDKAAVYAAAQRRSDSLRIILLTGDRDGWKAAALHADSALTKAGGAIGGLQDVAKPERCFLGLVKCPSRTALVAISLVVGIGGGIALDEVFHRRFTPLPAVRRVAAQPDRTSP
jgi:hypothetical protein